MYAIAVDFLIPPSVRAFKLRAPSSTGYFCVPDLTREGTRPAHLKLCDAQNSTLVRLVPKADKYRLLSPCVEVLKCLYRFPVRHQKVPILGSVPAISHNYFIRELRR